MSRLILTWGFLLAISCNSGELPKSPPGSSAPLQSSSGESRNALNTSSTTAESKSAEAVTVPGKVTTSTAMTTLKTNSGSTTFNFSGNDQKYTVPEGVSEITVKMWGGGGAAPMNCVLESRGGAGGYSKKTIKTTPGDILTLIVGAGGTSYKLAGGGGGRSEIIRKLDRLIVAGGGGGGAVGGNGGAGGGENGEAGTAKQSGEINFAATGGTQTGVGTGGSGQYFGTNVSTPIAHKGRDGKGPLGGLSICDNSISDSSGKYNYGGGWYCDAPEKTTASAGGGGGYFGGGSGGGGWSGRAELGDEDGYTGAGGGSGYVAGNEGETLPGSGAIPAKSDDPEREKSGDGGCLNAQKSDGEAGRIIIRWEKKN